MKSKKLTTSEETSRKPRFIEGTRDADAEMTKEEFARVIGRLGKLQAPTRDADEDRAAIE